MVGFVPSIQNDGRILELYIRWKIRLEMLQNFMSEYCRSLLVELSKLQYLRTDASSRLLFGTCY